MTASLAAWRDLWRSAPTDMQRDVIHLAFMAPSMAYAFAFLWMMLPS